MKRIYLQIFVLCSFAVASAQRFESDFPSNYQPSTIDLSNLIREKTEEVKSEYFHYPRNVRLDQIDFVAKSCNYDAMMVESGQILANRELDEFLNAIGRHVVKWNQILARKEFHFYALRSSIVNAFASDNGNIYVTLGLIAQVQNEDQLAFVLCHEIAHVLKQHNLENATAVSLRLNNVNEVTRDDVGKFDDKVHGFSKALESEADELGFELYRNAGYDIKEIDGVYDLLATSGYCVSSDSFDWKIPFTSINTPSELLGERSRFNIDKLEGDNGSNTHPSISFRRLAIAELCKSAQGLSVDKRKIRKGHSFETLRRNAVTELGDCYIHDFSFYTAFLYNYSLWKSGNENQKCKSNMVRAWIGLSQFKYDKGFLDQHGTFSEFGDAQQLKHLNLKLSYKENASLTALMALGLWKSDTDNKETQKVLSLSVELLEHASTKLGSSLGLIDRISELLTWPGVDSFLNGIDTELLQRVLTEDSLSLKASLRGGQDTSVDGYIMSYCKGFNINETKLSTLDPITSHRMTMNIVNHAEDIFGNYEVKISSLGPYLISSDLPKINPYHFMNLRRLMALQEELPVNKGSLRIDMLLEDAVFDSVMSRLKSRYIVDCIMVSHYKAPAPLNFLGAAGQIYFGVFLPGSLPQAALNQFVGRTKYLCILSVYDAQSNSTVTFSKEVDKTLGNRANEKFMFQMVVDEYLRSRR